MVPELKKESYEKRKFDWKIRRSKVNVITS